MSKFKIGDKVRVVTKGKQSWPDVGREFVVKEAGDIYVIGHGVSTSGHPDYGIYDNNLELVRAKNGPKFKVGDRVIANNMIYTDQEFTITEVVKVDDTGNGSFYYSGDPKGNGVWEKFLTLVPREFRAGDLIRAEKDELVVAGRLSDSAYSGLTIQPLGWPLKSLKRDAFTITLVEAAPEPVVDLFPLPEEDGLYISQVYALFRLRQGEWISVGSGQPVRLETLKSDRHWPLGLIAEPVDK